ncbi:MAG: pyridoxal phosphate-dependent aminotransferase [Anaerolineae bacterium]
MPASPARRSPDFSARALSIGPTGIRKMFDLATADTIQFGLGEPDFQPPAIAIEAFHRAMVDGYNKYTTQAGYPPLREAVAGLWSAYRPGLSEGNVCITMSGTNALLDCAMILVDPGDNILVPDPGFPLYGPHATIFGGEERSYRCTFEHEFVPEIETLEALVDDRTRAIVLNFPSNPTGATLTPAQRDTLLDFARRHDLWIISDEVYDRIIYDRPHVSFLTPDYDKILLVNSFSKTFAMTGWRIGYVLSPHPEAMAQIMKLQYYVTACSNDAMQRAVLTALTEVPDYPVQMVGAFRARRDRMVERLNAMPGVSCHRPEGAFYVFPRVEVAGLDAEDIAMAILADGVLCSPGTAFGAAGAGHLRLAYTTSMANIERGLDIIERTLARLQLTSTPARA